MAFIPVPNTVQAEIVYELDGQICENTLHYTLGTATPNLADITDLIETISATIRSNIIPLLTNTITLLRLVGTLIEVADGLQYISTTGLPAAGGSTDLPLPNNVSLAMSLRTGLSGRSFRGRSYIVGLTQGAVVGNTVNTSEIAALLTAYETLRVPPTDGAWQMSVVSRFNGGAARTVGVATPVTQVIVTDATVDSQRRRLPGRGR
jgi:hypothetical protein